MLLKLFMNAMLFWLDFSACCTGCCIYWTLANSYAAFMKPDPNICGFVCCCISML